jgi:hypothetical protein
VLWAARGLPFHPEQGRDFSVGIVGENGRMELNSQGYQEELIASPSLFKLHFGGGGGNGGVEKPRSMLLNKIALAR